MKRDLLIPPKCKPVIDLLNTFLNCVCNCGKIIKEDNTRNGKRTIFIIVKESKQLRLKSNIFLT